MIARWETFAEQTALEHVERATPEEAAAYLAVLLLWMTGVVALIVRKLRAA